jgi:hypothetical protein
VTAVEFAATPLERVLGAELGRAIEALHRDHGVEMVFRDAAERFEGDDASRRSSRRRTKDQGDLAWSASASSRSDRGRGRGDRRQRDSGRRHSPHGSGRRVGDRRRRQATILSSGRSEWNTSTAPLKMGGPWRGTSGRRRSARRPALVLVGSVRRADPDVWVRHDLG